MRLHDHKYLGRSLEQLYLQLKNDFSSVIQVDSDLRYIMCKVLGISSTEFVTKSHMIPHPQYAEDILRIVMKRSSGEPLAYILGSQHFYGLEFQVGPEVLIPRPETELLVEMALDSMTGSSRVLDVGTGSGCIAISVKKNRPDATVEAWDICDKALNLATRNARHHSAEVEFAQKDALQDATWQSTGEGFDLILCNPPYIAREEADQMSREVLDHEPDLALFAGDNGLCFYEKLANRASWKLKSHGKLICEIGYLQGQSVRELFLSLGWQVKLFQDYSGRDRIIIAERTGMEL